MRGHGNFLEIKKLSQKFAFCACPNFESCKLASGAKASSLLDLRTKFVLDSFDSFWLGSALKTA